MVYLGIYLRVWYTGLYLRVWYTGLYFRVCIMVVYLKVCITAVYLRVVPRQNLLSSPVSLLADCLYVPNSHLSVRNEEQTGSRAGVTVLMLLGV